MGKYGSTLVIDGQCVDSSTPKYIKVFFKGGEADQMLNSSNLFYTRDTDPKDFYNNDWLQMRISNGVYHTSPGEPVRPWSVSAVKAIRFIRFVRWDCKTAWNSRGRHIPILIYRVDVCHFSTDGLNTLFHLEANLCMESVLDFDIRGGNWVRAEEEGFHSSQKIQSKVLITQTENGGPQRRLDPDDRLLMMYQLYLTAPGMVFNWLDDNPNLDHPSFRKLLHDAMISYKDDDLWKNTVVS